MASYPTAVYSPSGKSAGQTIQAAFFNDPEAEIVAIEDGLKNGLAHGLTISTGGLTVSTGSVNVGGPSSLATLNVNGGSTLASLTVSGGSTLASLSVTGNSTVGGDLTVNGVITAAAVNLVQPRTKVTLSSAASSVTHDTWTCLSWDVEAYDSTGMHSTSVNSSRIFLTSSGIWFVGGQVEWNILTNTSTMLSRVRIVANDNEGVCGDAKYLGVWGSGAVTQPVSGLYYATDTASYITLRVYQNCGGNMVVAGSSGSGLGPTQFWAQKIGV